MDAPRMMDPRRVVDTDTHSLTAWLPVPGFGMLPVNAFVLEAEQPVLIDTGLAALREPFMAALRDMLALRELRWIWITHADADHVGNLAAVLEEAPNARVVTTFLGMGKLGMQGLPLDRVHLLNPGQALDLGDRRLRAIAPPCFDAPETTAAFDEATGTLFSSDCFGALLDRPYADAREIAPEALRDGMIGWASVDAPWLGVADAQRFGATLRGIAALEARTLLGSHLPPARGLVDEFLPVLDAAREAPRFVGPDQAALEAAMARTAA